MESRDQIAVSEVEAARQLGVSIGGLRKWRKAGRGPRYVRLGRIIRYRISDVDEWLSQQTHGPVVNCHKSDSRR